MDDEFLASIDRFIFKTHLSVKFWDFGLAIEGFASTCILDWCFTSHLLSPAASPDFDGSVSSIQFTEGLE